MADTSHPRFVFYDPTGRRWKRFRRFLQTAGIFAAMLVLLLVLAAFSNPQLPQLGLPQVQRLTAFAEVRSIIRGETAARNVPFRKASKDVKYVRSASPVIHPRTAAKAGEGQPVVFGFYVNWDRSSIVSLRLNLHHMTHLVPEWLMLQNGNGDLEDQTDPTVLAIAQQANLPVLVMVTNYKDGWRPENVRAILRDKDRRATLIGNILSNVQEHKFAGVNIDFEQLERRDRALLVQFMTELREEFQPRGLLVSESVPVEDPGYDLKRLAEMNDFIVPMVYDEHYQSGSPGPVASQDWFDGQLEKLAKEVPPEKTIIGFGAYGYDWIIGQSGGSEVAFGDVMAAAVQHKAKVGWDNDQENPVLRYTSEGSEQHEIWFLDAVTALNQVSDVADYGFRGVAVWRLGAEDPSLWSVLKRETWPAAAKYDPTQLWKLTPNKSVSQYGEGEVIRITDTPREGKRNVWKREDNDFAEDYETLPSYYVVELTGKPADNKVINLSFDDGPDENYTPEILDILKRYNVPATFFVVGVNAERYPWLVKRIYSEGHEIGNHTYSHPNIATTSEERTRLELTATQRIIENQVGVSTILFRPPYNADSEPQTPEEIIPIWRAQQSGYIAIGERIDPRDWQKDITADAIVHEVIEEQDNGHIVLLHDGGGTRTATIEALPRIIEHFRSAGYRFVSLGELMNKSRAEMMPVPSEEEMRWARIEGRAFDTKSNFVKAVGILFLVAIYLTLLRTLVFGVLACVQKLRLRKQHFDRSFRPPVSVVIAAYNEEKVIARTIGSILGNGYEDLEIVVVDDGSKDGTLKVLREQFGSHPHVQILTQANGGKSAALNNAIAHATNEILIAVDADTIFRPGTIAYLTRHFSDPKVGAVSGNARVGNRQKWITRFQSIEYIYGFNLDRRALDLLNAITVVPGAVGAWRKELILKAGGFGHDTLAEDTDLTLAIRREGYRIRYEENAIAYTEAPQDTRSLAKQRFRWAFGTLQAAWKHRDAIFDPEYGSLGFVALPSIWIFQVMLSALSPFAEIAMIIALFSGNWPLVLAYYMAFFGLELLAGFVAFGLEGEKPWDLSLLFFQRIYYRQLMHYVLLKSLVYAMKGRLVGWGKLERHATVQGT